ncbi:glycoside hydrolase family 9 protein [uncultured Deinococcus sp.]|uniref:glycoside hydrolase family 9 protein n=1 Tax=uncultured Deinococcus sp. TaxID=158789 RepID=UPI0025D3ACF0|nr:glycoside hydrolase family 9 protein [uncultured Deinococcus sp.]
MSHRPRPALALISTGLLLCACAAGQPQQPPPAAPSVTLSADASSVTASGDLKLQATVSGSGTVARVVFYDRGRKIGQDATAPYDLTLRADPEQNGVHAYSAQAVTTTGVSGISAPLPVSVQIADTRTVDLLTNGSFGAGQDPWWTSGGLGVAVAGGEACLNITQPGANPYDVIFGQGGVGLTQGATYTLTFTARADQATGFKTLLQFDGAPYTSYFAADVEVSPTPKTYTYTFTMKETSDPKATFQFQVGARLATKVCLSAISLKGPVYGSVGTPTTTPDLALVRVNQTGYLPAKPKRATVPFESDKPLPWTLYSGARTKVGSGMTTVFGQDAASGEYVHQADFSAVTTPGTGYVLDVAGFTSHPFDIGTDVYSTLKTDALGYFYQARSGIPIEAQYVADPKLARPAGHAGAAPNQGDTAVTCFTGTDVRGNVWPGCGYTLNAAKGWYDAGDHGKYVVNSGVSVWTLLDLAERDARTNVSNADGTLKIPERANGKSDLLDEVRWNLDFMLAMQVPDGQTLNLPRGDQSASLGALTLTPTPAGGLVHHKLTDVAWTGLPLRPDQDPQRRAVYYPTTAATLNLAATAAQCARVYRTVDPAYSATCLTAATRAWNAARATPDVYAYDLYVGGGPYNDTTVDDEFYWAAAELYVTTGDAQYLAFLKASPLYLQAPVDRELAWMELTAAGTITLATAPSGLPAADVQQAQQNLITAAKRYRSDVATQGYHLPFRGATADWGSNSGILNRSVVMALAYDFTKDASYQDAVLEGMNYLLGRNPMDKSYISGYGERPLQNPHHRFWAHSLDAALPAPPRGVVSGGPNSVSFSDPVAAKLKGKCTGLTCYIDDIGAYTMNEVTINWNAPLAWVASFVQQSTRP